MYSKIALLLLLCASMGGCAPTHWSYPGPQSDANRLAFECQYKGDMMAKGTGGFAGLVSYTTFADCMKAYGFIPQK